MPLESPPYFDSLFGLTIYAINPKNAEDKQVKSSKELRDLFPFYSIPAERVLGEDDTHNSSLGSLISGFFDMSEADLDPAIAEEIKQLRIIVGKANKDIQKQSDELLSAVVNNSIGFGYPNIEELKLGVTTQLSIDEQIKNQTKLSYISGTNNESLPSSHNGLGYKNLVKMEFLLAAFAKDIDKRGVACLPILFIEEPESHMHPQMQTAFAAYLEKFLSKSKWKALYQKLADARNKRAIDVFEVIRQTELVPIPPMLDSWYELYQKAPETIYASDTSIQAFLQLDYAEFVAAKAFLHPEAQFSTEHGVKGEEYDNVIFVISKGWNQYQFETYAPMITGQASIPKGKEASFERNRNLFYVCCSRPKKRLFFFISLKTDPVFMAFLSKIAGDNNIYTYCQFLEKQR